MGWDRSGGIKSSTTTPWDGYPIIFGFPVFHLMISCLPSVFWKSSIPSTNFRGFLVMKRQHSARVSMTGYFSCIPSNSPLSQALERAPEQICLRPCTRALGELKQRRSKLSQVARCRPWNRRLLISSGRADASIYAALRITARLIGRPHHPKPGTSSTEPQIKRH